jgi:CheY-like chemotaxis protein
MAKKPRVLCVDDMPENLRIRALLLNTFGCETIAVPDCRTALRAVSDTEVDLVVIDYHLADGETGEDLARDLRIIRPDIPLIMLTGDPRLPNSVYGCVDVVLLKGTSSPKGLLEAIEKLLSDTTLRPRRRMLVSDPTNKTS